MSDRSTETRGKTAAEQPSTAAPAASGVSDSLATAQAKTDSGISSPVGGSTPFGPAAVQAKDLAVSQRKPGASSGSESAAAPPSSGGAALPEELRAKMESAFQTDFSDVRVHQGSAASDIGAVAFTQGNNLHFAPGAYSPGTPKGDALIGHELTHVVQQRNGRVNATIDVNGMPVNDSAALEAEADSAGARAAAGRSASVSGGSSSTGAQRKAVQRKGNTKAPPGRKLRAALAEEDGTGKPRWGKAAYKWDQLLFDAKDKNLQKQVTLFETAVDSRLLKQDGNYDPAWAMWDEVNENRSVYTLQGPLIDPKELGLSGGITRVADGGATFSYNYDGSAKQAFTSRLPAKMKGSPVEAFVYANNAYSDFLDPKTDLGGQITGKADLGWWSSLADGAATDLDELCKALTLNDASFKAGVMKYTITAEDMKVLGEDWGFHRPTAFDGMGQGDQSDPMWAASGPGAKWGMTKSVKRVREGVAGPIPVGLADTAEWIPGPLKPEHDLGWTDFTARSGASSKKSDKKVETDPAKKGPDPDYIEYFKRLPLSATKTSDGFDFTKSQGTAHQQAICTIGADPKRGLVEAKAQFKSDLEAAEYPYLSDTKVLDEQWARFQAHHSHIDWNHTGDATELPVGAKPVEMAILSEEFIIKTKSNGSNLPARAVGSVLIDDKASSATKAQGKVDKRLAQTHLNERFAEKFKQLWDGTAQKNQDRGLKEGWDWNLIVTRAEYPVLLKDLGDIELELLTTDVHGHIGEMKVDSRNKKLEFVSELGKITPKGDKEPLDYRVKGTIDLDTISLNGAFNPLGLDIARSSIAKAMEVEAGIALAEQGVLGAGKVLLAAEDEVRKRAQPEMYKWDLDLNEIEAVLIYGDEARQTEQSDEDVEAKKKAKEFEDQEKPGEPVTLGFRTPLFEATHKKKEGPIKLVVTGQAVVLPLPVNGTDRVLAPEDKKQARMVIQGLVRDAVATKVASHGIKGLMSRLDELSDAMRMLGAGPLMLAGVSLDKLSPVIAQGADAEEANAAGADEETGEGMVGLADEGPSFLDSLEFEVVEKNGKKNGIVKLAEWDMPKYGMKLRDGMVSARLNNKGGIKFIEDGTITAIIAVDGIDTIEAKLSKVQINRKGLVSGIGGVTMLTSTKPVKKGKLGFTVDTGSEGELELKKNKLDEIRSTKNGLKVTVYESDKKFLGLTLKGRLYNKLKKLDGTATAELLRQETIAEKLGPNKDWGLELLPSTDLSASVEDNKLQSLTGNIKLGLEDANGDFASIQLVGATYEHKSKPEFSFDSAAASIARPAMLFTSNGYEFWLDAGAGVNVTAVDNVITKLSGTLPLAVRDEEGPLVKITLNGSFDGDNVTGTGTATLQRPFKLASELGPDKTWTIAVLDDSALSATFTNSELTSISGSVHAGIFDGPDMWLTVHGSGKYDHATRSFSTVDAATVAVVKDQVIARRETAAVSILKDSGVSAVITNNKLMSLAGKLGAKYSEGADDYFSLKLEGSYDGVTGKAKGSGTFTTLKDYSRKVAGVDVTLKKDSSAEVDFADNAVTDVKGKASVDFKRDTLSVNVSGDVDYDVTKTNLRSLSGTATLKDPWKASDNVTVTKATASATVKENALESVDGTLEAEFSDKDGLLAKGGVTGGWKDGKVHGSGEVQLCRNIDLKLGGGIVARVKGDKKQKLTYAKVTLVDGAIEKLAGSVAVDILRDGKVVASISVSGTYNLQTEVLESLVADVVIQGPFTFFDGGVSVLELSAHIEVKDNTLLKVSGGAKLTMDALNISKADISFSWRTDGEQEYFAFTAKFLWTLFKEKAEGGGERSLSGMIDIAYKEDGSFLATAAATYKMDDGFEASAKVSITEDLIPLIEHAEIKFTKNLMDEKKLFDFEQRLFKLSFPIFYVLRIAGYLDLGMSFTVGALDLDGKLGVYNWRPTVDGSIPKFKASLSTEWPLTFEARITAGIEAGLDIFVASAGVGIGASLIFEVPINVKPSIEFEGGPEGYGGAFGLGLSIEPALFLEVAPYWFADVIFFGPWEGEMANWRFDLAKFAPIEWSDEFEFGHRSKPVKAKKAPGKSQGLNKKSENKGNVKPPKNAESMTEPGDGPNKKQNTPAELPGGKTLDGGSLMGKQSEASAGADGKDDVKEKAKEKPQFERAMTGLQAGGRLVKTLFRFIKMMALGPVGMMFLMMDVAAGRLSFEQVKKDFDDTKDGIKAVIEMFGDSSKKWGFTYMLGQYLDGKLTLYGLLMKDDDLVRDAVKRGDHLAPALTADDHAGMLKILTKGTNYCGDEDEDAVLEILDAAGRAGHINAAVAKTPGGYDQIYWKLDGEQDTKLTKLFKKYGVSSSATSRAIAAKAEVAERIKRDTSVAEASQEFTVLYNKLDRSWTRNEVADVLREKGESKAISVAKGYIYKQSRARYYELLADELPWGKRMEMWDYDLNTRIEKAKSILGPTKVRLIELRARAPKDLKAKMLTWMFKPESEILSLCEQWLKDNNKTVKKGI